MASGIRLTQEEFIAKASFFNPNLDFSKAKYVNGKTAIIAICPIHGEFEMLARSFFKTICCPKCDLEKRKQRFIEDAIKIHGNKYDYSRVDYISDKTPIEIVCPIHGSFWQRPTSHKRGYGCSKCSNKHKPTTEEWIGKAKKLYNGKYDLSKVVYVSNKTPVVVICPEHGEFYPLPNNYINGVSGCPKCNDIRKHKQFSKTTEQFIKESIEIHDNLYDYTNTVYVNATTNVKILCKEHGEFEQNPGAHLSGCGCPKCKLKNQTKLYNKLKESFPNENIVFEYKAKWLGKQRIDIYFPKYNIGIEYDGIQHFQPSDRFGGIEKFEKTKQWDLLKEKRCLENNCKLFRLDYKYKVQDYKNIVKLITKYMKIQNERPEEYVEQ